MTFWHGHLWRETSRQFNRSDSVATRAEGPNMVQLARELEFGITVVELACKVCGDVKAVRYVGDSGNRGATP